MGFFCRDKKKQTGQIFHSWLARDAIKDNVILLPQSSTDPPFIGIFVIILRLRLNGVQFSRRWSSKKTLYTYGNMVFRVILRENRLWRSLKKGASKACVSKLFFPTFLCLEMLDEIKIHAYSCREPVWTLFPLFTYEMYTRYVWKLKSIVGFYRESNFKIESPFVFFD